MVSVIHNHNELSWELTVKGTQHTGSLFLSFSFSYCTDMEQPNQYSLCKDVHFNNWGVKEHGSEEDITLKEPPKTKRESKGPD